MEGYSEAVRCTVNIAFTKNILITKISYIDDICNKIRRYNNNKDVI